MIDSIFVVHWLKGFKYLLTVSTLIVLDIGMMSCFLSEMSEIADRRRLHFISNVYLALYEIDRRNHKADNIFRPFSC